MNESPLKTHKYLPFLIPIIFATIGTYTAVFLHKSLTTDGYFHLSTSQILFNKLSYSGMASLGWPPLYSILTCTLALFASVDLSAKLVSLFSATGLLILLPYLSKRFGGGILPGLIMQVILLLSPPFLEISLQSENHMLDAFLFCVALYCAMKVFSSEDFSTLSVGFVVFASLACLTRYTSWVLLVTFVTTYLFRRAGRDNLRVSLSSAGYVFAVNASWLIYNYLENGYFLSSEKGGGVIITWGMIENQLLNMTRTEFFLSSQFNINALDIIVNNPGLYITQIGINFVKFLEITLYAFPPLGFFSPLVLVGFISLFKNINKTENLFLVLTALAYCSFIVMIRFSWVYFFHLGIYISTLGLSELIRFMSVYSSGLNYGPLIKKSILTACFLILTLQVYNFSDDYMHSIERKFKVDWFPINELERKLKKFKARTRNRRNVRIMSSIYFFPTLYRLSFSERYRLVLSPLPSFPVENFLCYSGFSRRKMTFYRKFNYPPNLLRHQYIPPDYLLLSHKLGEAIKRKITQGSRKVIEKLSPVKGWNLRGNFQLYHVNKTQLSCHRNTS